jgi:signal transduction histidine kinase
VNPPRRARGLSLRHRVAVHGAALGLVLCAAFATVAWIVAEDYEHLLVAQVLQAEAEDTRQRLAAGRPADLPTSAQLRGWLFDPAAAPPALDPAWLVLPPGVHELPDAGSDGLHLGVFELGAQRLLYVVDLGPIEQAERYLVGFSLAIMLIGGVIAALAALALAGRALRPVRELAEQVAALPVEAQPTALAETFADDGLRRVAAAIDDYQRRLGQAASAERAFFADASHELRSPVAALRGAAEVLLDDPQLPAALRRRLQRIDRATDELAQLIDALLLTAREPPGPADAQALQPLLAEVCSALAARAEARSVMLQAPEDNADARCLVPPRWLHTLTLNLLRALLDRPGVSALRLRVHAEGFDVAIEGDSDGHQAARSDLGFPLQLTARLCQRLGGALQVHPGRLQVRLPMAAAAAQSSAAGDSRRR